MTPTKVEKTGQAVGEWSKLTVKGKQSVLWDTLSVGLLQAFRVEDTAS